MPFLQITPRPFISGGVQTYAPIASGVYGISNSREWIYIGETENIQGALLAHLRDVSASLMRHEPTGFVYEVCDGAHRHGRQDRLVLEYEPVCNRRSARHS
jgi:hypothetical protein